MKSIGPSINDNIIVSWLASVCGVMDSLRSLPSVTKVQERHEVIAYWHYSLSSA